MMTDPAAAEQGETTPEPIQVQQVPVAEVAPHPDNVRAKVGKVDDLAASIAEQGVLQPLVVVSIGAFREHTTPAHYMAAAKANAQYIVLAGHRRLAAARKAKVATIPVIVRDDLAAAELTTTTMIVENVQRQGLSPLEEARAFARLRDNVGWSQRQIATATGVSNGQVAKRLSLLRLPEPVAAELEAGKLLVADALKLLELPDEDHLEVWQTAKRETWRKLTEVIDSRKRIRKAVQQEAELRAELADRGIEVVDQITLRRILGDDHWSHQHQHGTKLEDITHPDNTMATVIRYNATVEVRYYSRTIPLDATDQDDEDDLAWLDGDDEGASGGSATAERRAEHEQRLAEIEVDREAGAKAAAARAEACAWLVTEGAADGILTTALAAGILADFVLVPECLDAWDPTHTAAGWLSTEFVDDAGDTTPEEIWLDDHAAAGGNTTIRAGVALALADLERTMPAVRDHRGDLAIWSPRDVRHVRRLVAYADHQLTEIERRVINHSEAVRTAAAEQGQAEEVSA